MTWMKDNLIFVKKPEKSKTVFWDPDVLCVWWSELQSETEKPSYKQTQTALYHWCFKNVRLMCKM